MSRLARNVALAIPALLVALFAGCTRGGAEATVSGAVTLDGHPLKEGLIRFVPADGKSQTADASIVNGTFQAAVPPGEKVIEITAPRVIGRIKMYETPDSPVVDKVAELLPDHYNIRSKLRLSVAKGTQEKNFELKSK